MQVARFYYLLETGQLLRPEYSAKMKEILSKPALSHKFVAGLQDESDTTLAAAVRQLGNFPFLPGGVVSNREQVQQISVRQLYNPERRAALFTVPGLLGLILTMTMIMFTSIAIVRERERGNMELLITTPVRNLELMIGKITP